jgi:hypothetical protein
MNTFRKQLFTRLCLAIRANLARMNAVDISGSRHRAESNTVQGFERIVPIPHLSNACLAESEIARQGLNLQQISFEPGRKVGALFSNESLFWY